MITAITHGRALAIRAAALREIERMSDLGYLTQPDLFDAVLRLVRTLPAEDDLTPWWQEICGRTMPGKIDTDEVRRTFDNAVMRAALERLTVLPAGAGDTAHDEPTGRRRGRLRRASDIPMRSTTWLWEQRVPMNSLTLLGGREGTGKSTLVYHLVAQITTGKLEGDYFGAPRSVIIAATEDSWSQTVVPRLVAAGADLTRVFQIDIVTASGGGTQISLPGDIDDARDTIASTDAILLVLDPLLSRLDGKLDSHKDSEVRAGLEPLVAMADELGLAIVGLIHPNKGSGSDVLTSIMGSRAFVAVARSVIFVAKDPDDENDRKRVCGVAKANLANAADAPNLGFEIDSMTVGHDEQLDKTITAGALRWVDGDYRQSINDIAAGGNENDDERDDRTFAEAWLLEELTRRGGTSTAEELARAAGGAGIAKRTLQRARVKLKITTQRSGFGGCSVWALPSHGSTTTAGSSRATAVSASPGESVTNDIYGTYGATDSPVVPYVPYMPVAPGPPRGDATAYTGSGLFAPAQPAEPEGAQA